MTLGFIESKVDSNLCFKFEGGRQVMLMLSVDALFSRHGGVAECGWNLPRRREVCSRDPKEVQMMDCKAMTTPMESNLNLLSDASSETVDATMYRQMIGSLMYLTDMRPNICFAMNTLRCVHLIAEKHILRYCWPRELY